ncbi:MAG: phosphotransferase [Desertimonas sp.]
MGEPADPRHPPGPLLGSGRAAEVYDLGDGTVLRRYRRADRDASYEARVMAMMAAAGVRVPAVRRADGPDLVMERIDGPTMLEALGAAPWMLPQFARLLSRLQREIAAVEAPDWMLASSASPTQRHSVLHLDLHPMNVLMSPVGPTVIDWTNAAGGPAGFDAALTVVLGATSEVGTSVVERLGQRLFVAAFRRLRGHGLIEPYLAAACDHRLADPALTPGERVAVAAMRTRVRRRRAERNNRS